MLHKDHIGKCTLWRQLLSLQVSMAKLYLVYVSWLSMWCSSAAQHHTTQVTVGLSQIRTVKILKISNIKALKAPTSFTHL